jgi:XTP/dITP diphosphohydrolase
VPSRAKAGVVGVNRDRARDTWILASGNRGKLEELGAMLADFDIELIAQSELGIPTVEETAATFVENALMKARNAAAHGRLPALADDSGLVVAALDGAPGICSARFAGASATDAQNVAKLLEELSDVPDGSRHAHFHCSIVLLRSANDPAPLIAEGRWHGEITRAPSGAGGFGYDPIFFDPALGVTAATLARAEKNRVSHRGQALAALTRGLSRR